MIWNDRMITAWAQAGGVTPFDEALVNPASLDLRLGNLIRVPRRYWELYSNCAIGKQTAAANLWDEPKEFDKFVLDPGRLVLCHSMEFTRIPNNACAMLLSKSSTGRIGLEHLHAGYGDPGFIGEWVFELKNLAPWPIELVAGERYMQLVMMTMAEEPQRNYTVTGRYNGQTGPEAHR
jgi:dCTP deaminase